jgi:putative transposase
MAKHTHQGHRVFTVNFHIVFCPKYRKRILTGPVRARLEELFREKIAALRGEVGAMEVMPDHVHLFVRMTPDYAPRDIVRHVKGYSSRVIRQEFPALRWMPALWSPSYFLGSTGHVSSSVVLDYIERQNGMD